MANQPNPQERLSLQEINERIDKYKDKFVYSELANQLDTALRGFDVTKAKSLFVGYQHEYQYLDACWTDSSDNKKTLRIKYKAKARIEKMKIDEIAKFIIAYTKLKTQNSINNFMRIKHKLKPGQYEYTYDVTFSQPMDI